MKQKASSIIFEGLSLKQVRKFFGDTDFKEVLFIWCFIHQYKAM